MSNLFNTLLLHPLGWLLGTIYNFIGSYGLAIIVFTLFTKIVLLPLAIKTQKGQVTMMKMRPKEEAVRKQHANDKEKMNQAIMQLYKEEKYSPFAGCLPVLIQLPIILALYNVIRSPLTYVMQLPKDVIGKMADALGVATKGDQLAIARAAANAPEKVAEFIKSTKLIDFDFFGMNLAAVPSLKVLNLLWIIPVLSGATAYIQSFYQQHTNPMPENQAGGSTMKTMMYFMPLMSVYIAFVLPAGVGLYWIASNVFTIIQMVILNKFHNPRKMYEQEVARLNEIKALEKEKKVKANKENASKNNNGNASKNNKGKKKAQPVTDKENSGEEE